MLAQAVTGTPGHVNTMATACAKFFDYFPRARMKPGDIYLTNDPWLGAGHLNDFVLLKPCFLGDRLVAFVSCTSHLVDIGGRCLGPDGSDVYDEGLYVPPIKLVEEGLPSDLFLTLLKANSRSPLQAEGDVFALIACCDMGAAGTVKMMRDFGIESLKALAARILETSETTTRARVAALADGRYSYEMAVDGYDLPVTLKACLEIAGDRLVLDFHGSAPPSKHGINVPINYTEAYAVFGLKCAIAPDIPNNHGSLAVFEVTAPEGSILNAQKPLPVCSRHILGQLLPDVALGCLSGLMPEAIPAEGAATLWDLPLKGTFQGQAFAAELVHNGGTGARASRDGLSATAYPSGVMGSLVEITESTTPLMIRRREFRPDSGGPGQRRGGLGQVLELEALPGAPLTIYGTVDRVRHPARGRAGGQAGARGGFLHSGGRAFYGKGACPLEPGERLTVMTPGGGGFGPPDQRLPAAIAEDLKNGLISAQAAATVYRGLTAAAATTVKTADLPSPSRGRARIGIIVPVSNSNLEPDMQVMRPGGVSLHFMRAGGYDLDQVPDSDQMRKFAAAGLEDVLAALIAVRPDIILYGCTSATLSSGPDYDREFAARIETATGLPAVTAAGALTAALHQLGARKVGFCSPYTEALNAEAAAFLELSGIAVVRNAYVGEDLGNYGQGDLTPEEVFQLGLRADHPDAEAIVLSCTDMRSVEVVERLESVLGKPVVTSNQAMMHAVIARLGLDARVPGRLGTLSNSATPAPRAAE